MLGTRRALHWDLSGAGHLSHAPAPYQCAQPPRPPYQRATIGVPLRLGRGLPHTTCTQPGHHTNKQQSGCRPGWGRGCSTPPVAHWGHHTTRQQSRRPPGSRACCPTPHLASCLRCSLPGASPSPAAPAGTRGGSLATAAVGTSPTLRPRGGGVGIPAQGHAPRIPAAPMERRSSVKCSGGASPVPNPATVPTGSNRGAPKAGEGGCPTQAVTHPGYHTNMRQTRRPPGWGGGCT